MILTITTFIGEGALQFINNGGYMILSLLQANQKKLGGK